MKRTSSNSSPAKAPTRKRARGTPQTAITEEQRVLAFLKECGARPMSRATRRRLAAAGCLGMPDE